MKNTTLFIRLSIYLAVGLLLAGAVGAQERVRAGDAASADAFIAPSGGDTELIDAYDFEPPAFAPGILDGQAGWTVFLASTVEPTIDTSNPFDGVQHMQISEDPAAGLGTLVGGFSPDLGPQDITLPSSVEVYIWVGGTGGADYDIVPQAPSQAFLTARVKFSFTGDLLLLDDTGGGLAFVDTGIDWTPGVWICIRIEVDPVANTIDYYMDDALIYSSVAGVFAGTQIEQVVLIGDNWNIGESSDFDGLTINTDATPRPPIIEIPTLGQFGLAFLILSLLGAGIHRLRKR